MKRRRGRRRAVWAATALMLGALVAGAVAWAVPAVWGTVARVEVTGTVGLAASDIRARAAVARGTRLWGLDLEAVAARVERHPWVRSAHAHVRLPGVLVIEVVEHVPVAVARLGRRAGASTVLVAEGGTILGPVKHQPGLPMIAGASRSRPHDLAVAVEVLAGLRLANPPVARLEEVVVDVSRSGDPVVLLGDGTRLRMGRDAYEEKWRRYAAIAVDAGRRVARDRVIDLRFRDRAVVTAWKNP